MLFNVLIPTQFASKSVFLTIGFVVAFEETSYRITLFHRIVSSYVMARFTEVSCSPTVPDCEGAAVLAFVFNVVFTVLLAVGFSTVEVHCLTQSASKLLRLW